MFAEPAVVRGCYTTPPPPGSPAQRSAAQADGAAGERGRGEGAGSRLRRVWGGGQLWDPINYVTLGCRFCMDAKMRGGVLGSLGSSGDEGVFLAVPNYLGSGTANLLTHMSFLSRASLGKGKEQGARHSGHTPPLARAPSRRTQAGTALCNSLSGKAKVSDGGIPGNTMAKALRAGAVHTVKRNKARGSNWRVVWKGLGRERGEGKGEWQGFAGGGEMFGFFRMM